MEAYAFDKKVIKAVIEGLKQVFADTNEDKAKALSNLYKLHVFREKIELKQKNCMFLLFKLPDSVIITNILCCFELKEIKAICFVSRRFNALIKTNVFFRCYVKNYERTSIRINMNTFGNMHRREVKEIEDTQVSTETRKKVNLLLEAKLNANNTKIQALKDGIEVMKRLIENERIAKLKAINKTSELESELRIVKEEWNAKGLSLNKNVSELEHKVYCSLITVDRNEE